MYAPTKVYKSTLRCTQSSINIRRKEMHAECVI
jgi:hypothetical protein